MTKTVTIPEKRLSDMLNALREIESISKDLSTFNPTYDKIHKIARKGLNIKEE